MIDLDERIDYCIGNTNYQKEPPVDDGRKTFLFDGSQKGLIYQEDVERLFNYSKRDCLWFRCSDSRYTGPNYPIITKTRDIHNPESKGIIGSLEYYRHFGMMPQVMQVDPPWQAKENTIVWRGATTGIGKDNRKCSRLDFVRKYSKTYDVGFASFAGKWSQNNLETCNLYYRGAMSMAKMSMYKFLPVLDGNDKASALNWILLSNSVPLMPKPRFHSWLCEDFLIPNIHYVELNEDYSNLPDKIQWCLDHDSECNNIAQNGKDFIMSNFNKETEIKVEKSLVERIEVLYNNL